MYCIIANLCESFLYQIADCVWTELCEWEWYTPLKNGSKNGKHKEMKLKSSDVDSDNDSRMGVCGTVHSWWHLWEKALLIIKGFIES